MKKRDFLKAAFVTTVALLLPETDKARSEARAGKLWSLNEMEKTGG